MMKLTKEEVESLKREDPPLLRMATYWHSLCDDNLAMRKMLEKLEEMMPKYVCTSVPREDRPCGQCLICKLKELIGGDA